MISVRYNPPLDRVSFEKISELVEKAHPTAEVAEVVFPSGERLLIIRQDEFPLTYLHIQPGQRLEYEAEGKGPLRVRGI